MTGPQVGAGGSPLPGGSCEVARVANGNTET